jgi:hypothetical protein
VDIQTVGGLDTSIDDSLGLTSIAGAFQAWLQDQVQTSPATAVFWAPYGWRSAGDWLPVSSVEQLAVRISTTWRPQGNVCFASGCPGGGGRNVGAIGLIGRDELGWALNISDGAKHLGHVRRVDYRYDNYDSFSALTAAQISWSWIVDGTIPEGLILRPR